MLTTHTTSPRSRWTPTRPTPFSRSPKGPRRSSRTFGTTSSGRSPSPPARISDPPTRHNCLSICSINIGSLSNIRKPISRAVRDLGLHVVCFQEPRRVVPELLPYSSANHSESDTKTPRYTHSSPFATASSGSLCSWTPASSEWSWTRAGVPDPRPEPLPEPLLETLPDPQTDRKWRDLFQQVMSVVLTYRSQGFVVVCGDFNLELKSKKLWQLQEALGHHLAAPAGFVRTGTWRGRSTSCLRASSS